MKRYGLLSRICALGLLCCLLLTMLPVSALPGAEEAERFGVELPAQSFSAGTEDIAVTALADEGVFPAGTRMRVEPIQPEEAMDAAQALVGEEVQVISALAVDITFTDPEGGEVQPAIPEGVHVTLSTERELQGERYQLVHLDEAGEAETVETAEIDADGESLDVAFDAEHFSVYAIIGTDETPENYTNRRTYIFTVDGVEHARQVVKNGDTLNEPEEPSGSSAFLGWFWDDGGTETPVAFGVVNDIARNEEQDEIRTAYARFSDVCSAFFYDADGETILYTVSRTRSDLKNVELSEVYEAIADRLPGDKRLDGWKDRSGGAYYDRNGTLTLTGRDVSLLAQYTGSHLVTLDPNTEDATSLDGANTLYIEDGERLSRPEDPTRAGYAFGGWYTTADCLYAYDFGKQLTGDLTIFAKWEPLESLYDIYLWTQTLDNGQREKDGVSYRLAAVYPITEDSGETGAWTGVREAVLADLLDQGVLDARYYDELESNQNQTVRVEGDGSSRLDVYFNLRTFRLSFDAGQVEVQGKDPETGADVTETVPGQLGAENTLSFTVRLGESLEGLWPQEPTLEAEGYVFSGWRRESDGVLRSTIVTTADESLLAPNGEPQDQYFIAQYLPAKGSGTYTIIYQLENADKSGYTERRQTVISDTAPTDWPELAGFDAPTVTTGDRGMTITLQYRRSRYVLRFHNGKATTRYTVKTGATLSRYNHTPSVSRAGLESWYSFQGWYLDENLQYPLVLTDTNGEPALVPDRDMDLYAKWGPKEISISFQCAGGILESTQNGRKPDITILAGTTLTDLGEQPYRAGYDLSGWLDPDGELVDFSTRIFTEDTRLTAKWTDTVYYTVAYQGLRTGDAAPTDSGRYQLGESVPVLGPETAGGDFLGWRSLVGARIYKAGETLRFTTADLADTEYVIQLTAVYAAGQAGTVTVTYHANHPDSDETKETAGIVPNTDITLLGAGTFTRAGYTLSGWSTRADGTGAFFAPGAKAAADNLGDNDLYAVWEPREDTGYRVVHYGAPLKADGPWEVLLSETRTGETDSEIATSWRTEELPGFTPDTAKTEETAADKGQTLGAEGVTAAIAGDGTTEIAYYYARKTYTVSYGFTGAVPDGAEAKLPAAQTYPYGATVTVSDTLESAFDVYRFYGWNTSASLAIEDGTFTMPARDVNFAASLVPMEGATAYKVVEYLQDTDGNYTETITENRRGTADTAITVVPKSYYGFTFDESKTAADGKQSGTIQSGLELKLYYKRNTHKLSYQYENTVPAGAGAVPGSTTQYYGETVALRAAPAVPAGWQFDGWHVIDETGLDWTGTGFTMPNQDLTVLGSFSLVAVNYQVEHYQQNVEGDGYTLFQTDTLQGITGSKVFAQSRGFTGFHYVTTPDTVLSGAVAGDGSLTLKLYYDRDLYTVHYYYEGDAPVYYENEEEKEAQCAVADKTYRYGQTVRVENDPDPVAGYTFSGWRSGQLSDGALLTAADSFTMPDSQVQIHGSFNANTDTGYTVRYFVESMEAAGSYELFETDDSRTGATGSRVTAEAITVAGYVPNPEAEGTVSSGIVRGDGKLILSLYYDRQSYRVTYSYTNTDLPTGAGQLPAEEIRKYGETVQVAANPYVPAGYSFRYVLDGETYNGWRTKVGADTEVSKGQTSFVMPSHDVELIGTFAADDQTKYTVNHYRENLDGTYDLVQQVLYGTTDTWVTAQPSAFVGDYADVKVDPEDQRTISGGNINGNGTLQLALYYKRERHTVAYRIIGASPVPDDAIPADEERLAGELVDYPDAPDTPQGYTFNGWSVTGEERYDPLTQEPIGFKMPDSDMTVFGSFTADATTTYTVKFFEENLAGDYVLNAGKTLKLEAQVGETVQYSAAASITGFTLDGANGDSVSAAKAQRDGSTELRFYYKRNTYTITYDYNMEPEEDDEGYPTGTVQCKYGQRFDVPDPEDYFEYTRFDCWTAIEGTGTVDEELASNDREWFTMPASNVVLCGMIKNGGDLKYSIEYYFETAVGYQPKATYSITGLVGSRRTTEAPTPEIDGYTLDSTAAGIKLTGTGTETLKVYYKINTYYHVRYQYEGDVPTGAPGAPADDTAYGPGKKDVLLRDTPQLEGYTFVGWRQYSGISVKIRNGRFDMPASDVVFVGQFVPESANSLRNYIINYHLESVNDPGRFGVLRQASRNYGLAGETVPTDPDSIVLELEGFAYSQADTEELGLTQGIIPENSEETLNLDLYYTRNSHTVTYRYDSNYLPYDGCEYPAVPAAETFQYGETVTVQPLGQLADGSDFKGYDFQWKVAGLRTSLSSTGDTVFTMPDEDVEIIGSFTPRHDTGYTVTYYVDCLDPLASGSEEEIFRQVTERGTTATAVEIVPETVEGMTFDASHPDNRLSGLIDNNGTLALELHYTRDEYDVVYAYQGADIDGAPALPKTLKQKYGATVALAQDDWDQPPPGYSFAGWTTAETLTDRSFTMPAHSVTVRGEFIPDSATPYTVSHYLEPLSGTTYALREQYTLTGTTGTTASADPHAYKGFDYASGDSRTEAAASIQGNGSTELRLYYTRKHSTVTFVYDDSCPDDTLTAPDPVTGRFEAVTALPEAPALPGYDFTWHSDSIALQDDGTFAMPAEDGTVTGTFNARQDTAYTVTHYVNKVGKTDEYEVLERYTRTGATGSTVTAQAKTYDGVTADPGNDAALTSATLAGDGTTELRLYYKRDSYTVSYRIEGVGPTDVTLPATATVEYGAAVNIAPDLTEQAGETWGDEYSFDGWQTQNLLVKNNSFSMPARSVTVIGSFTRHGGKRYTIQHFYQQMDGSYDETSPDKTEVLYGADGATVTGVYYAAEGFTPENEIKTAVIQEDGSTVLKLYYTRNQSGVTYDYTGEAPAGAELPDQTVVSYGDTVTLAAAPSVAGYTFDGWKYQGETVTELEMPDHPVRLTGSFTPEAGTEYLVAYYLQNLDGTDYVLEGKYPQTGVTGENAVAAPVEGMPGFTYNRERSQATASGTVTVEPKLELALYYDRDRYTVRYQFTGTVPDGAVLPEEKALLYGETCAVAADPSVTGYNFSGWTTGDLTLTGTEFTVPAHDVTFTGSFTPVQRTTYTVHHMSESLTDETVFEEERTEFFTGATGASVHAAAGSFYGLTFSQSLTDRDGRESAEVAGDGSTALYLYYTRNSHNLTYSYTGKVPQGASALPEDRTLKVGTPVTLAEAASAPGYDFSGWLDGDGEPAAEAFDMPDQNVAITGSFTARTDTPYRVEYYLGSGGSYTLSVSRSQDLTGETDSEVVIDPPAISGYTFNSGEIRNVLRGTISGDGQLVLRLYYTKNPVDDSDKVEDVKLEDGIIIRLTKTVDGVLLKVEVIVPEGAAEAYQETPLTLPVTLTAGGNVPVAISIADGQTMLLELPVENLTEGTVAVSVDEDGNRTAVPKTRQSESGVTVPVTDGMTIQLENRSHGFIDIGGHWAEADIEYAAARGLVVGTSEDIYSPEMTATRGMVMTVLARMDGVDTTNSKPWYGRGQMWAVEQNVSDGSRPTEVITREQLVTMLYRNAGEPGYTEDLTAFVDEKKVAPYARPAMCWAVEQDIIRGMGSDDLQPATAANRAMLAAVLSRFLQKTTG